MLADSMIILEGRVPHKIELTQSVCLRQSYDTEHGIMATAIIRGIAFAFLFYLRGRFHNEMDKIHAKARQYLE